MNVLHINSNYLTTALHQEMIKHLDVQGISNTVIAPTYDLKRCIITPRDNVLVMECFKKRDRYIFSLKQHKIIKSIKSTVDIKASDIIHAYTLFTDGNCAYELSKQYGIPYVVAVRNTDIGFFRYRKNLYRRGIKILENAAAVFFMSEIIRNRVIQGYVPRNKQKDIFEKSYIIPNGIDDFWLENKNVDKMNGRQELLDHLKARKLNVIFAGVICKRKNPLATQEALQVLRKEGWEIRYTAIGRIADKKLYEKMSEYADTIYVEQQAKEKLLIYYRENDLFVMPSRSETFGLVYAEALTQGLPVIYTSGQGFDGQFEEGVVGYSVDDQSPTDIADKIRMAVENYEHLTERCLDLADKFRWNDICKQYKVIYEKLLSAKRNRGCI